MATAIIGVGNIGKTVAKQLADGGEPLVLAAREVSAAQAAAEEVGGDSRGASIAEAISASEAIVFAVWFDAIKELISEHAQLLSGKVIVDPSNPVAANEAGEFARTLPDGVSAASVIDNLLPDGAKLVKAFGTLAAPSLAARANETPRIALFYATDDDAAGTAAERLIRTAGFDPVKAGGLDAAIRIEMFGELHEFGGLNGSLLDAEQAQAAAAQLQA